MTGYVRKLVAALIITVLVAALLAAEAVSRRSDSPRNEPPKEDNVVACRVLEAHALPQQGVALVVFHHRDAADRERLSLLLRQRSGATVELQVSGGIWQPATVLRLKSCFGRGLLFYPAGDTRLAEKDVFLLRFPSQR